MREINFGWFLRYCHANGASVFFIVVFCHMFRGLFYGSFMYPRVFLWNIGVIILLFMILTAFLGYVLPWGQMSYWAATVITNLASVVPFIGKFILYWLWGGFSVSSATLNKFFSLHFLFPFLILVLSLLHIFLLHLHGSSNPLGIDSFELIVFTPYSLIKDYFFLIVYFFGFSILVFFLPNLVNHSDNYIPANPLSTPTHIVPEWYLLSFYAILRSIPHKLTGVLALVAAILILAILPILGTGYIRSGRFRPLYRFFFWNLFLTSFFLSYLGGQPAEDLFIGFSQIETFTYFFILLIAVPFASCFDFWFLVFSALNFTDLYCNTIISEKFKYMNFYNVSDSVFGDNNINHCYN